MNGSGAFLGDSSHESLEGLIGRIPAKRLTRTVVHQIGHGVQRILLIRQALFVNLARAEVSKPLDGLKLNGIGTLQ